MLVDQVSIGNDSLFNELPKDNFMLPANTPQAPIEESKLHFFNLPLEIRLKIYGYLLPPRHHTVVTQIPYNGYFYNTSTIPANSATSFYPFGRTAPNAAKQGYTTYKVLTTNHRANFPACSIYPELLRVNKQILAEAEPVLYGSNEVTWDFGVHLDALLAFWGDRSGVARSCVRRLRIASQLPVVEASGKGQDVSTLWTKTCDFIERDMTGLRNLDLTMWSGYDVHAAFPIPASPTPASGTVTPEEMSQEREDSKARMRDWEFIAGLLRMPAIREARLTCWEFEESQKAAQEMVGNSNFGNWIAGRMVGDEVVRARMVRDGVVAEIVVVWRV